MATDKNRAAVAERDGNGASGRERRAHQRITVLFEIDYRADDTFLFAYITDISAMGIFVRTTQPEPAGTHLFLRFTPPGGAESIECEGDVIWINPPRDGLSLNPGMGIQFTDLSDEQRDTIVGLVRTFAYLDREADKDGRQ